VQIFRTLLERTGYQRRATESRFALARRSADSGEQSLPTRLVTSDVFVSLLSDGALSRPNVVEIFDANGVSFVAVTQQFNTTTSMGRLTLNVLLLFAQFEREVTGERIREKIAASKRKGIWMGGKVPLGYDVSDRRLVINEAEAHQVKQIYQRSLELGSVRLLKQDLDQRGVASTVRLSRTGTR